MGAMNDGADLGRSRRAGAKAWLGALILAPTLAAPVAAALENPPHVDIRFLGEHLPEAAQDARAFSLPWPAEAAEAGRWRAFAGAGYSSARAEFLDEKGFLATLGAERGFAGDRALVLFGFFDRFTVSGGAGEQVLSARFLASSPLDLPETARFSNAGGSFRHVGVGSAWSFRISPAAARTPWRGEAGLLVDRLTLDAYRLDFELLDGADAGARGTLDQSGAATFVTPFFGVGRTLPIGRRFDLVPRVLAGAPLPAGDFDGRLIGPGYDRSSRDAGGHPGKIGDGFAALSVGLLHRPSGLEVDFGGALAYPLFERLTHDGVSRSFLLSFSWRGR